MYPCNGNFDIWTWNTAQNEVYSNDIFSKSANIRRKLRIWYHLLKKSLIENFSFVR